MVKETIVVIGAGVLGLSSALVLLENLPSSQYRVLLLASHFPTDPNHPSYATTNAGAHYRPIPANTPQLKAEAHLGQITHERFKKIASTRPEWGVTLLEGIDYVSGEATPAYQALLPEYKALEGFRVLEKHEMPAGVEFGARYETYTVDTETYTYHLLRQIRLLGGELLRRRLNDPNEAFYLEGHNVKLVVNCSGLGFNDPKSFIIRGQICLVSNPCDRTITQQHADGTWSFIIPRGLNGGTIIGGTKQPHDWNPTPSLEVRKQLLKNAAKMYPAILGKDKKFNVIRDVVGRRPAREGGMRLEVEDFPGERKIVHAYGAGGRGIELSWGVAEEVWKMVKPNVAASGSHL
ncbi:hypothetical protein VTO42DRAFT_8414 [Malbranchea cinnamomea]